MISAEQLWEKKEVIGLILVVLFFAGGILFLGSLKGEKKAWGEVEAVERTSKGKRYEVLVRGKPGGNRIFREAIVQPTGRLAPLAKKKQGSEFTVKVIKAEDTHEGWKIVEIVADDE